MTEQRNDTFVNNRLTTSILYLCESEWGIVTVAIAIAIAVTVRICIQRLHVAIVRVTKAHTTAQRFIQKQKKN